VDLLAATSGVASCMGGVGPGFGVLSYDWTAMSPTGKAIGFLCMWIGRLELASLPAIFPGIVEEIMPRRPFYT